MPDNTLATAASTPPNELPTFEEALVALNEVVQTLEAGNIPLQTSLTLLQKGMALAKQCETALEQAESVLEQLTLSADGELTTQRLAWIDENETSDEVDEDADDEETQ